LSPSLKLLEVSHKYINNQLVTSDSKSYEGKIVNYLVGYSFMYIITGMKRDAQATRKRILDAATAEFSRYGVAGARVDRIAAASGSNKAMIYTYFGDKEGLLNAVAEDLLAWHTQDVPMDAYNLPEYAARVFERYQNHPELTRLVNWHRLERGSGEVKSAKITESYESKLNAIRQAQQEGVISDGFSAPLLLELISALVELRPDPVGSSLDSQKHADRKQAIKDAVTRLIAK
jgi:AcrR family transcriptional regulator